MTAHRYLSGHAKDVRPTSVRHAWYCQYILNYSTQSQIFFRIAIPPFEHCSRPSGVGKKAICNDQTCFGLLVGMAPWWMIRSHDWILHAYAFGQFRSNVEWDVLEFRSSWYSECDQARSAKVFEQFEKVGSLDEPMWESEDNDCYEYIEEQGGKEDGEEEELEEEKEEEEKEEMLDWIYLHSCLGL